MLGLFLSGAISDKIGRKKSLIAFSIFQIISSVAMYFVRSYESLMVTLCLSGLSMSMVMIPREHENILLIKEFKFCYDMNLTNNLYVSKYFHLSHPSYALLSEICLIRYRSSLASLNTSNANIGWLSGLCLGLVIPVKFYTCILCFPSVIFLLLCWNMPESPM